MEPETRLFKVEIRKIGDSGRILAGMPIVYGKRSEYLGFYEYIKRGAASEALKISDIRALYGHNSDTLLPIGRQSAGTLRLNETKTGVDVEIDPPKRNTFVDALIESIERRDIREMSFGFTVEEDEWTNLDKDHPIRTITKIGKIFDISYVTFAAYPDTSVAIRSMEEQKEEIKRKMQAERDKKTSGAEYRKRELDLRNRIVP